MAKKTRGFVTSGTVHGGQHLTTEGGTTYGRSGDDIYEDGRLVADEAHAAHVRERLDQTFKNR
ncbi:hypothetical protein ACWGIB_27410 [Streptomyces xiamenensis]